jgi:hypothetical protein
VEKFGENSEFILAYADYLAAGIYGKKFNEKSRLFMRTEIHEELKNTNLIRAERTNYFKNSGYDQWKLDSDLNYYLIRLATGIILLCRNERELLLPYTKFVNIGVFYPPPYNIIYGVNSFKQLAGMMGLTIKEDIEVDWK